MEKTSLGVIVGRPRLVRERWFFAPSGLAGLVCRACDNLSKKSPWGKRRQNASGKLILEKQ
jgi:hypothetical protein